METDEDNSADSVSSTDTPASEAAGVDEEVDDEETQDNDNIEDSSPAAASPSGDGEPPAQDEETEDGGLLTDAPMVEYITIAFADSRTDEIKEQRGTFGTFNFRLIKGASAFTRLKCSDPYQTDCTQGLVCSSV